ncbi:hypothetical protein AC579_407 [Pseudocercospora musae]|uniref:Uncharacterized protein n=1 Tax=Pseudocercospora musae TaxID=113226 RepID=A0A139GY96_9PEZI|nr:hypothetical protein AC579_407 [Pseudocercospora musae]KXS95164.1 hypothetical protein AC579_407 [Pseudocercospora musae]
MNLLLEVFLLYHLLVANFRILMLSMLQIRESTTGRLFKVPSWPLHSPRNLRRIACTYLGDLYGPRNTTFIAAVLIVIEPLSIAIKTEV